MISLLAKRFIPNAQAVTDPAVRQRYGILCGGVGICLNILLFGGKILAGLLSGSIAIVADAFNNLSDAGSSIVSLVGFRLAGQKPDKNHPFGHGRVEYLSGFIVSMMILFMGFELLKSSFDAALHPGTVELSWLTAGILLASIAVKLYMYRYNKTIGKKISSAAMEATAADSMGDVIATGAVLISALVGHFLHIPIDGWCGLLVAVLILRAGYQAAVDTINPLLGQAPSPEFVEEVETLVRSHKEIVGIHDLIVHDYGPGRRMITLHAEVPAEGDLIELHDVVDTVENELSEKLRCLATIHMDPISSDRETQTLRQEVEKLVQTIDPGITIHDFRMVKGVTHTNLIFDVLTPYGFSYTKDHLRREIENRVREMDGNYFAVIKVEHGFV